MIDHDNGGALLGLAGRIDRGDGIGDGIGEVETLPGLERTGVEFLAHGGHHGIGILGVDADILQHPGQGVARVRGHSAAFHAGVGVGIVGVVLASSAFCGSLAQISFAKSA